MTNNHHLQSGCSSSANSTAAGSRSRTQYRGFIPATSGSVPPPPLGWRGLILMDSLDERNERRFQYRQKIYDAGGLRGSAPVPAKPAGYGGMHSVPPQELGGLPWRGSWRQCGPRVST